MCTELSHLSCASGGKHLLGHVGAWVLGRFPFLGLWQVREEAFVSIAVDAQQDTVAAKSDEWCHGLALYLDAIGFCGVWFAVGFQCDALEVPLYAFFCWDILEAHVSVSVFVEVAGSGRSLLADDGDAEGCAWQVVGDALERAARHEGFHLGLRH